MRSFQTEDKYANRFRVAGTFRSGSNHGPAIQVIVAVLPVQFD